MQKFFVLLIIGVLILNGCATLKKKISKLSHGISKEKVIELWDQPTQKIKLGKTPEGYPVEVWEYYKKSIPLLRKEEVCILIFVDEELYSWKINDPKFAFEELVKLGVLKQDSSEFGFLQYQKSLQNAAEQAEQTRRTMEVIRTYKFYKNTQMQLEHMQRMRTLQQQQFRPLPKPAQPVKPQQRQ